jgi:hypothetical protein
VPSGRHRPAVTVSRFAEPTRATQPPVASGASRSAPASEPAVQRSVSFPASAATATVPAAGVVAGPAPIGRTEASSEDGEAAGDGLEMADDQVEWHSVPLQVARLEDHQAASLSRTEMPPIQRVVTPGAAAHTDRPVNSEVAGLEPYETVQRTSPAAEPSQRPSTVMPALPIVQRSPAPADKPEGAAPAARRSGGVSFAAMFSTASEAAETGYTTVQLLADDDSMAAETTAADASWGLDATQAPAVQRQGDAPAPVSTPAPGGASAPAAGAGLAGADLDEMARRLFDPLAAKLRAEFWLDRERAGLMTDARP